MRKRRICCFCQRWASGGIESAIRSLLLALPMEELEVDIVAEVVEDSVFTAELRHHGVELQQLSGKLHRGSKGLFRQLLRRRKYDVVHLHLYQGMALSYARIARQEGVSICIAHSHNADLRPGVTRGLKLILHKLGCRLYGKDATLRWACSREAGSFLFPRGDFEIVPNGIDTARFALDATAREENRSRWGDCFLLGHVGRLCSRKNQQFLLEVLARLGKPEYRLLLIGDGEDKKRLEAHAKALGIASQVVFYGETDRIPALMSAMDAFLLPSLFEGLPISAMEAQASGLPVLCADGITREVKQTEKVQFLPLSADLWAKAVEALPRRREKGCLPIDIREVAEEIKKVYLEDRHGEYQDLGDRADI